MGKLIYLHNQKEKDAFLSYADHSDWVYFRLSNDETKVFSGKGDSDIYQLIISEKYDNWEYRVMDFIHYIESTELNGAIEITEEKLSIAKFKYGSHMFNESFLREYEPNVLIHSTSLKSWDSIQKNRCLKSWNSLHKAGLITKKNPIGKLLGDPVEFSDYVMLGSGLTCEVVVSSSNKGEINCDIHAIYEPGVRLYLDARLLASDGLLIRDGAHLKVKDKLEYEKYLLFVATSENVDVNQKEWTPKAFSDKADQVFTLNCDYKR